MIQRNGTWELTQPRAHLFDHPCISITSRRFNQARTFFMFPFLAGQIIELDQVCAVVERAGGATAAAAEGHLRRPQEPSEHR